MWLLAPTASGNSEKYSRNRLVVAAESIFRSSGRPPGLTAGNPSGSIGR